MRQARPGGPYVQPISSAGTPLVDEKGRGKYTLEASTTYYFPLAGASALIIGAHVQWDAALVLTSVTVEDCNMGPSDVTDYSSTAGEWIDEDPSTAFVGLVGAGATHTNGVVAVTGGAAGGAMFHVGNSGASRTRLKVVVGATGGVIRVGVHGKS